MNTKKILSLILVCGMLAGMVPAALADNETPVTDPPVVTESPAPTETIPVESPAPVEEPTPTETTEPTGPEQEEPPMLFAAPAPTTPATTLPEAQDGKITLTGDVTLADTYTVSSGNETIDLAGHNITISDQKNILVTGAGTLTIMDNTASSAPSVTPGSDYKYTVTYTSGKIQNTTGSSGTQATINVEDGGTLIVESGTISANKGIGIGVIGNRGGTNAQDTTPVSSTATINGGYVVGRESGVTIEGRGAKLTVAGGVLVAEDNAPVMGNGTGSTSKYCGDTTIKISGGTLISHIESQGYIPCGIYHPQKGTLEITGGEIYAPNGLGILMRGGTLNMSDGLIAAVPASSSGGQVGDFNGAARGGITVDTKANYYDGKNIEVTISGGTVTTNNSVDALYVIKDTQSGVDPKKFEVTGGTFSTDPKAYVADGYYAEKAESETTYAVKKFDASAIKLPPAYNLSKISVGTVSESSGTYTVPLKGTEIPSGMTGITDVDNLFSHITAEWLAAHTTLPKFTVITAGFPKLPGMTSVEVKQTSKTLADYYFDESGTCYDPSGTITKDTGKNTATKTKTHSSLTAADTTVELAFLIEDGDSVNFTLKWTGDGDKTATYNYTFTSAGLTFASSGGSTADTTVTLPTTSVGSDGKTSATVDATTAGSVTSALNSATSGTVTIDASNTSAGTAKTSEVTIPKTIMSAAKEKDNVELAIKTPVGEIQLDKKASAALSGTTGDVKLSIAKTEESGKAPKFEVKFTDNSTEKPINEANITLTFNVGTELNNPSLICIDSEKIGALSGQKYSKTDGTITGTTTHLSTFSLTDLKVEDATTGGLGKISKVTSTYSNLPDSDKVYMTVQATTNDKNTFLTIPVASATAVPVSYANGAKLAIWITYGQPDVASGTPAKTNILATYPANI